MGKKVLELLGLAHINFLINLKCTFIHIGRQLFSPRLLVEMLKSLFKYRVVLSMHLQECRGDEKVRNISLASPGVVRQGKVMR
jgi:type III secretory pathway component EscU